jgi:outer membrane protein assembly factor BamB
MTHVTTLGRVGLAVAIVALGQLGLGQPAFAQWPQFRGPNGAGVDAGTHGYPIAFSPTSGVVWQAAMPYGQSSPVIVGSQVYVTARDGAELLTIALDAATGAERWRRAVKPPRIQEAYKANDPASPTPAADAQGVVVFFADVGLVAYAPDGTERWRAPLGPFLNFYGMSGSPIIAGDLVVLVCDQASGSFMVAVDRATGRQRWRRARPEASTAWSTPMVFAPPAGDAQLVVLGSTRLDSYTLASGEPRWWLPLASNGAITTPVAHGDLLLVATSSSTEPWLESFDSLLKRLDADKDGRITKAEFIKDTAGGWAEHFGWLDLNRDDLLLAAEYDVARNMGIGEFGVAAVRPAAARGRLEPSSVLWRFKKNLPYIPAPLVYDGRYYMVKNGGIITSLDLATGQPLKEGRTQGAPGEYFASPVAADGKVFVSSVGGRVTVLKAGDQWEVLGVNDLGSEIHATPALAGGRIYVRTRDTLYCFGGAKS